MPHPNVLFLMSDQHNANSMGCTGGVVRTPALDAVAADGVIFDNAFCNNPICAPSRTCYHSGQYCRTHRIIGNDVFELDDDNPHSLGAVFRRMGYQTALVGKGHMVGKWNEEAYEHLRYCDLCDAPRHDPTKNHYFQYLIDQGLADQYDLGALPPDHHGRGKAYWVSTMPIEHTVETWTGNESLAFLKGRDTERPFFLHMTFQRPHDPHAPSPPADTMYDPAELELPSSARDYFENRFAGKPDIVRKPVQEGRLYPYTPADELDLKRAMAAHFALVSCIDEQIGRVIDYLKETGQYENTIICYVADHGEFAGEHGLTLKNLGIYESIHRVPFLLRWPGGPSGRHVEGIVESVDLYPTLCELAGIDVPEVVEGRSVVPVATGDAPGKDQAVCEWRWGGDAPNINAIRTPEWRLVYYGHDHGGELYDRTADPDELTNLFDDPDYRQVRIELMERLFDHVADFELKSSPAHDAALVEETGNSLTRLMHKSGRKWSQLSPMRR